MLGIQYFLGGLISFLVLKGGLIGEGAKKRIYGNVVFANY